MSNTCYVLDTSILIKALVPEPGSDQAAALLTRATTSDARLVAPAFSWTEVGSVLLKKARTGQISLETASDLWRDVLALGIEYIDDDGIREAAWRLAAKYGLPTLYDAAFLAAAEVLSARGSHTEYWTADLSLVAGLGSQVPRYLHTL